MLVAWILVLVFLQHKYDLYSLITLRSPFIWRSESTTLELAVLSFVWAHQALATLLQTVQNQLGSIQINCVRRCKIKEDFKVLTLDLDCCKLGTHCKVASYISSSYYLHVKNMLVVVGGRWAITNMVSNVR